jgi:cysteine sulfinate desulfinase/cysteine desulfurase-like protein
MIYLDNNATAKLDARVLEAMMPFLTEDCGNRACAFWELPQCPVGRSPRMLM